MTISELIKGRSAIFQYYRDGNLIYKIDGTQFTFPIPIEDTGKGTFFPDHQAINLMRWIRKHHETLKKESNS